MDKIVGLITANFSINELNMLAGDRTIASLPYGSRYRIIDFPLSNMVNSGIMTVGIITPYKYRSIIDHVGAGREWSLDRKDEGLFI
ncbi:MAG: glucose-1-phosphate adenylyltransferase subunit GlgD, partial [Lachnospiraceae bacterium]|nr:glucose-1-phosphate adenylyltransferase subunit GlgD [Lachnospiraceae bacterium]